MACVPSNSTMPTAPLSTAGCEPVTGLLKKPAHHKKRIKDLVRQLLPMTPLTGDLGAADLEVLERWADPHELVKVGKARLTKVLAASLPWLA